FGQWLRLFGLTRRYRVHVMHMYLFSSTLVGTVASLLMGVPVKLAARREFGAWWMSATHHRAMALCHRVHQAVTGNSLEIVREVTELERVPRGKVHLIYNGIDYEDLRRRIAEAPAVDYRHHGPTLGMVANLVPVKGHRYLLDAMPAVVRRHPEVHLVLVGDGPLKDDLVDQCRRLDITDKVTFAGRQPAVNWLGRFDVAVQSSISEGGSNVVLEYMAAGLPMVVPSVGANGELLRHRETAWLVPPEDVDAFAEGLCAVLDDKELARAMGEAAHREVVDKYTSEQMVRRMEALYTDLVEARG
ncbi:MAG: glycosyltransferase, partial [Planctomycetota bacterium]